MKANGKDVYFDRCMRLVLHRPGRGTCVLEYNPLDDSRKIARIEVTATNQGFNSQESPAYFATIKIYNITNEVSTLISGRGVDLKLIAEKEAYEEASTGITTATLYVGHYNHEEKRADYTKLFTMKVNSSTTVRNGIDYVTTLYCWTDLDAIIAQNVVDLTKGTIDVNSLLDSYKAPTRETFDNVFRAAVMYSMLWKPVQKPLTLFPYNAQGTGAMSFVTDTKTSYSTSFLEEQETTTEWQYIKESERKLSNFDKWFKIKYLTSPKSDSSLSVPLEREATAEVKNFKITGVTSYEILNSIASTPGVNYGWLLDTSKTDNGRWVFKVWKIGQSYKDLSLADATPLYNYENFVETPTISADGSVKLKLMFRQFEPWDAIYMAIDNNRMSRLQEGFINSFEAQMSGMNYAPLVSGDYTLTQASADYVRQVKDNQGYLFNKPWQIMKITHTLSTHTKDWFTTIETFPLFGALS